MWTPERIRNLRKRYNQSQEEFAKHFRVTVEAVRVWEQGKGDPSGPVSVILDQLQAAIHQQELQTVSA